MERALSAKTESGSAAIFVGLVISIIALIGAIGFGVWAFTSRQDFKNNSDKKVASAVESAKKAQETELKKQFEISEKSPLKTFKSTPTYGSITFNYPKTWSVYLDDTNTSIPLQAYFKPDYVPAIRETAAYALRVELSSVPYEQVLAQYDGLIKIGKVTAAAYTPALLKGQANVQPGVLLSGSVRNGKQATMAVVKVRDKTLKVSTDSSDFLSDFNSTVLPSLTFIP